MSMMFIFSCGVSSSAVILPALSTLILPCTAVLVCKVDLILIPDLVTKASTLITEEISMAALK